MYIDLRNLVSISEANPNFSEIARMVDENGAIVILKNNSPWYVLIGYSKLHEDSDADNEALEVVATRILQKNKKVFEELAKW